MKISAYSVLLALVLALTAGGPLSRHTVAIAAQTGGRTAQKVAMAPDTLAYLDNQFCADELCRHGDWRSLVIVDATSQWRPDELVEVREALLALTAALADAGLDAQTLLAGYRLRRHAGEFYRPADRWVAAVHHDRGEIVLADAVFMRMDGFYIYHEFGHAVDRRLDRALTQTYTAALGMGEGDAAPSGSWIRTLTRTNTYELTADAFGIYVGTAYAGMTPPAYGETPVSVDYERISQTLAAALAEVAESEVTLSGH